MPSLPIEIFKDQMPQVGDKVELTVTNVTDTEVEFDTENIEVESADQENQEDAQMDTEDPASYQKMSASAMRKSLPVAKRDL